MVAAAVGGLAVFEGLSAGLQILVGAGLLSATAAYLFRERENRQQRLREVRGLLRLVGGEITYNNRMLEVFESEPDFIKQLPIGALKHEAWDEHQVRLAQLMKDGGRFAELLTYFRAAQFLETARTENLYRQQQYYDNDNALRGAADDAQAAIQAEIKQSWPWWRRWFGG